MARKAGNEPDNERIAGEEIIDTDVSQELRSSFLEYSMSVIVARALPDARDGLKPVQRRILYSMHEAGMVPSKGYHKCARVVGAVMGALHPHGDSAIYEALVRIAQSFSLRLPLVDGHGNFGSLDDGPAASRYTEARLAKAALPMVEELDEDTVDFKPNYDGRETEPVVLPAAFPNLLVNGTTGIAVGMATNMPPHNLVEVVSGLRAMLDNPKITVDELMEHIPGPDLPTGAMIAGLDGVRDAYRTGRGAFRMRATAEVTDVSARRRGIVVTELPYNVGPEKVIARIKELISDKKLQGVSDVRDYSDRKVGLRLVIECKTGFNPHAVLDDLYRLTPLEEGFSVNNVALVDNQPLTLGLRELCHHYLNHRLEVTRRRTEFRRRRAEARAHIVEGLVIALSDIDRVVALIKSSKDSANARAKLMKEFTLSEIQAEAILEMTLRRLTSLEVGKLKDELKELKKTISELVKLLASDKAMRSLVSDELDKVATTHGTPRRTLLLEGIPVSSQDAASLNIADDPCVVAITANGQIIKFDAQLQGKATKADLVVAQVDTTARATVGITTHVGRVIRIPVLEIPTKPVKLSDLGDVPTTERAIGVNQLSDDRLIVIGTRDGVVKRVTAGSLPTRSSLTTVIALREGDEVVGVGEMPTTGAEDTELIFITADARLLRFPADSVRPQGASAGGMAGIRTDDGHAVGFFVVNAATIGLADVITVTDSGSMKRSPLAEYPGKGRGTAGVRCHAFRKNEQRLTIVAVDASIVALSATGAVLELPAVSQRRDASGAQTETPPARFVRPRSR